MTIDTLVKTLVDLVCSQHNIKLRQNDISTKLMGTLGEKLDSYFAQLRRNISNCKLETFFWADYAIIVTINTLHSTHEQQRKLREDLNAKVAVSSSLEWIWPPGRVILGPIGPK